MLARKVKKQTPSNLNSEEVEEIRNAFQLFDTNNTGKISPADLKQAMQSLGFDTRNPTIYNMIAELETNDAAKQGGVSFDTFLDAVNYKLGDKESREGIRRIFDLFIDDPDTKTITINALKKVSKELGENMRPEELTEMLTRASKNGVEITFEEFYDIMTKKTF
jgi:Ca2+-binding EF-hand superfamily protein